MWNQRRVPLRCGALTVTAVSVMLGACSADRLSEMVPSVPSFSKFEWNPYSKVVVNTAPLSRTTVAPADYVGADGGCAGISQDRDTTEGLATEPAAAQPAPSRIALQMTECDVVKALGPPEKIDIGANERGERSVTMLYSRGGYPGLYRFTAGLLTVIERIEEPPPPPKPQKPAPKLRRSVT